jgi:hypothetical protein
MDTIECEEIRRRQWHEEYRAGRLSDEDAAAFEAHYFGCDRCFEELRFCDRVAVCLREDGATLFAREIEKARGTGGGHPVGNSLFGRLRAFFAPFSRGFALPRPVLVPAAIALLVLVAAGSWQVRDAARTSRLRGLSAPTPYPFIAADLRGPAGSEAFTEGMKLYGEGQYAQSAGCLARMLAVKPADPDGQFYCGVAHLLAGHPADAARSLREAVRLTPASMPYRWYLAQAELRLGRADSARAQLGRIVQARGEYAPQARGLLTEMDRILGTK